MDPITAALVQYGPFGILAAILFILHTSNIKNFREDQEKQRTLYREQLESERRSCVEMWHRQFELQLKHHEEIMDGIRSIACQGGFRRGETR